MSDQTITAEPETCVACDRPARWAQPTLVDGRISTVVDGQEVDTPTEPVCDEHLTRDLASPIGRPEPDGAAEIAELERHGYRRVDATRGGTRAGDRVRHVGQRYPEAYDGTATVLAVLRASESDYELVILRDAPLLPRMSRVTEWADYHTVKVNR